MLDINMSDVLNVLSLCAPYLIFFGVVLAAAVITMIAVKKIPRARKYMIRCQAGVAIVLVLMIVVNLILLQPLHTIVTLAMGGGKISDNTTAEAGEVIEDIVDEGIVLLENEDNLLPLVAGSNLNVFGWASTNPCYGGTGSGGVTLGDSYPMVSLLEGLGNAGFKLNTELEKFYVDYRADRPEVGMYAQDWTLPEPPVASYSDELINGATEFSDTAMIVITRVGGEGADLPTNLGSIESNNGEFESVDLDGWVIDLGVTYENNSEEYEDFPRDTHYLELSQSEKDMIELVCESFDDVILVFNGANAFELDFVNDYKQIKSVLWCAGAGQNGFNSLGKTVSGQVNPSGKTADTFVKDVAETPYYNNIGTYIYDNMSEFDADEFGLPTQVSFVNYVEGIYIGYRFYETAAEEGLIDYDETVSYPFGYGLSYTEFKQEMGALSVDADGNISIDVTVTNTGNTAGKDVVQVYYNPPYKDGGIEKASANLVAFDKTEQLEAGASQTLTITFNQEDMASYDTYGKGCYVLEAGDYGISIRKDSHTIIEEERYTLDAAISYNGDNARSTDTETATNQMEFAEGDLTYLSRANGFENYEEATAAPGSYTLSEEYKATFINNSNYNPEEYNDDSDEMPVVGADNGMALAEMRGKDYDDETWESLLDQLSISDMNTMIALGGYTTVEIVSVEKYATTDCDGPASITNNFTGAASIVFPPAVMIANTWNTDLSLEFGRSIGKMADEMDVSGWYAPAMNTHRSAFAGRNFEYYSEDGVLAGKMAANATVGAEEYGVYAYLKHFALNDQEAKRLSMLCTWSNEQAIREIYLKPFELAVKEGGAKAIMSSFNYIGMTWAGGCDALLNQILRNEWGFHGMVLTDYFGGYGFMNADQAIRNGNDICLTNYDTGCNYVKDTVSATSVQAMRQAAKNIMYTVVNSRAYSTEGSVGKLQTWEKTMFGIDAAVVLILAALELTVVKKGYQKRKEGVR